MFDHLLKNGIMDIWHSGYEAKVVDSNYKLHCFCGGEIVKTGVYPDSWQVVCLKCDYIWVED
jgi:hypothetical protein